MAGSRKRSSVGCRLLAVAIFAAFTLTPFSCARAEIIIDDFVDDLRINLPQDEHDRFLTSNVGELASTRAINAGGFESEPVGFLDINQLRPSAMTIEIPHTMRTDARATIYANLNYEFAPPFGGVDLTQGGLNNSVLLEFDGLTADSPLSRSRVYVLAMRHTQVGSINASSSYVSTYSPIPQSSDPFTLVFPFDSFQLARGTAIPYFDFSFIRELHVYLEPSSFDPDLPEQFNFQMVLESVRIGTVVPEPDTTVCLALCSTMWWFAPRRRFVLHGFSRKEWSHVERKN